MAGIFIIGLFSLNVLFVQAAAADPGSLPAEDRMTGTTEDSTTIRDPGRAESADELAELNIANTVTVTYDGGNGSINGALRILMILTAISLAPFLLITLTSFLRVIVVLHFTRAALNTNTAPPNNVMIGIALFLTFFIMNPTFTRIYTEAYVPFDTGQITQEEALEAAITPIREFMYRQTQKKDVDLFMEINQTTWDGETLEDIPTIVLIPSFIISELRTSFIIGFLIYIPFIVIDMVVASTLMSMGMMMLPPTTISMPFKILLFVLADGWNLIIGSLVKTFY
ncbi:MAG: flagellar type III secretion system pore protein FliP [Lachnospiraceae bacterium]|nr:flagellar type III secretion system pore protein FliP [Lachnospiraceae bacterium]